MASHVINLNKRGSHVERIEFGVLFEGRAGVGADSGVGALVAASVHGQWRVACDRTG